jgi:cytochrome bd-type quinol oxidase subunit 1
MNVLPRWNRAQRVMVAVMVLGVALGLVVGILIDAAAF